METVPGLLWARPWWVNAVLTVPLATWTLYRRGSGLDQPTAVAVSLFALAMGFLEAATVVYLRAATGLLTPTQTPRALMEAIPARLLRIEMYREAATLVMLICLAWLSARMLRTRLAVFLLSFAIWDLTYYAGLRVLIGWPVSLADVDVLFLIPVPWVARVWYPVAVSLFTAAGVLVPTFRKTTSSSAHGSEKLG